MFELEELTTSDRQPKVAKLVPTPHPQTTFQRMAAQPKCLFLDSSSQMEHVGRYSFLMAHPRQRLTLSKADAQQRSLAPSGAPWEHSILQELKRNLAAQQLEHCTDLPPFQGGWAGLFSFDFGRCLESVAEPLWDEFEIPWLDLNLYDVVLAWDHEADEAWLFSTGVPAESNAKRLDQAEKRMQETLHLLNRLPTSKDCRQQWSIQNEDALRESDLGRVHITAGSMRMRSNFDYPSYCRMIERGIEAIHAGDLFQVNLAQRLVYPISQPSAELYTRMRKVNAAPFSGYYDGGDYQLISASPERLVSLRDRQVEARPIKGTRPRFQRPEVDLNETQQLLASPKDRAENVMIVDLLRNDLSRVCEASSVQVEQLCKVEPYAFVQHLVSSVIGKLQPNRDGVDLMSVVFPGGSITGAPKVQSMKLISELEQTARGPYCGSLGYFSLDGSIDFNILIRTITAAKGWWQLPVGGGIVSDSDPHLEYEETWHKARGLITALPESTGPQR